MLVAGTAFGLVYSPSDRDIRNDVYARICRLLTEKQLARPSSMEIVAILVTKPAQMAKEAALQQMKERFQPDSRFVARSLEIVEGDYAKSRPYSIIDIFVTYSALSRLGGATREVSQCSFTERPGYGTDSGYDSELTAVGIGDSRLTPRDLEWTSVTQPAGLAFNAVKFEFKDRLNYVLARTYPHR